MPKASLSGYSQAHRQRSVTQQITKAMKMVATAKLRRAQENILANRPYAAKMFEILNSLAPGASSEAHPLLVPGAEAGGGGGVHFGPGPLRGFQHESHPARRAIPEGGEGAGGGNRPIFFRPERARLFPQEKGEYPPGIREFFGKVDYLLASRLGQELVRDYFDNRVDGIYLLYSEFSSAIQQRVVLKRILPVTSTEIPEGGERKGRTPKHAGATGLPRVDYIYEPSEGEILDKLLPMYVEVQVYRALLETVASEFGARMTAMENATSNAAEMIDKLTLIYNKARQASITKELIEIVSGAEALK